MDLEATRGICRLISADLAPASPQCPHRTHSFPLRLHLFKTGEPVISVKFCQYDYMMSFVVVTDRGMRSDGEREVVADPRVVPTDRDLRRGDRAGRGRHHQGAAGRAAVPARHRPTGPRPLHRHHQVLHATQPGFIQR